MGSGRTSRVFFDRGGREISPETGIVFIINSNEHALEAYSLHAYSLHALLYLVKPIRVEDICEAFRRLESLRKEQ